MWSKGQSKLSLYQGSSQLCKYLCVIRCTGSFEILSEYWNAACIDCMCTSHGGATVECRECTLLGIFQFWTLIDFFGVAWVVVTGVTWLAEARAMYDPADAE